MDERFWEEAALQDPLWAILSDPSRKGRKWEVNALFETGRREISLLLYRLCQLGHMPKPGVALDFGCGVGRLTQALGRAFETVIGVDVSPTMIHLADYLNHHTERIQYVLNRSESLAQFSDGTFDFVYSDIVLQHLVPDAALTYIGEFTRVLKPAGVAVFQLPSHPRPPSERNTAPMHMPGRAYHAEIRLLEGLPALLRTGEDATLLVEVQNASPVTWDQNVCGSLRIGNHWRNAADEMVVQDDGRAALPVVVEPGRTVAVQLTVRAPQDEGHFTCELDVVHEGISWFRDLGSPSRRAEVQVTDTAAMKDSTRTSPCEPLSLSRCDTLPDIYTLLPDNHEATIGPFPMYGIHRDVIETFLRERGTSVVYIEDDERGGPEWYGFRYYITKI